MNLSKMKVGNRLALGFAMVLLMLASIIGVGLNSMAAMQEQAEVITKVNNVQIGLANGMIDSVRDRMARVRNIALLSDEAQKAAEMQAIKDLVVKYAELQTRLGQMFDTLKRTLPEEKAAFARVRQAEQAAQPVIDKALQLAQANRAQETAAVLIGELRPLQNKWLDEIRDLIELEEKLNQKAADEAGTYYENARMLSILLGAIALLAGIGAAVVITRSLVRQLGGEPGYAAEVAMRIASGDLATPVEVRAGDTSSMMHAMKEMQARLAQIVGEVRTGTELIASASAQVAAGSQDLSSRTEEQASSLEETASSMEELTSTVKQNADNASQANTLAQAASGVASKGGTVIEQVVGTMGEINQSANKIVDIIGVIDGIAFQTNILALNAAVEAARAGEQGRGFAVVASEVRNLAQRSASAAKEIKTLIDDSVGKVETGSRLVNEAGTTMQEIVESVRRVADIMGEIMAASREQSSGIEQINQAVTQMDEVTQQNAALVEEAAAASEAMQDQAAKLAESVSVFKTSGAAAAALPAATRQRPAAPKAAAPKRPAPAPARSLAKGGPKELALARSGASDDWEEF